MAKAKEKKIRKESSKKKKKLFKKNSENKKSDLLKELKFEDLKEVAKEIIKTDETKIIQNQGFQNFISSSSSFSSPVLSRTQNNFESQDLESNLIQSSQNVEVKKEEKKYNPIIADYDDLERQKKINENLVASPRRRILEPTRIISGPKIVQNLEINSELQELRRQQTPNVENYVAHEEKFEESSQLPFERGMKYKGRKI